MSLNNLIWAQLLLTYGALLNINWDNFFNHLRHLQNTT